MAPPTPSLADLLDRATDRAAWVPDDSKSGARFEELRLDGVRHILKYQDARDDWLPGSATGDPGSRYLLAVDIVACFDRMPAEIDHAVVAADFDGQGLGRILCLRDVSGHLLEPGRTFTEQQQARYLDHMAALHAAFWGWRGRHRAHAAWRAAT